MVGDIRLGQDSCLLQVAVGDGALGVIFGDEVCLNIVGESRSPEYRLMVLGENHSPHSFSASVDCAKGSRSVWNDFAKASGSFHQASSQSFEIGKVVSEVLIDSDSVLVSMFESELQG